MPKDLTHGARHIVLRPSKVEKEPYTDCDKDDCINKKSKLCDKCRGRIYGKGGYQWGE